MRLADRTRREVGQATSAGRLRVLATAACAEQVAGAVVADFNRRIPRAAVELTVGSTDCAATALAEDVADIVLGVRPATSPGHAVESVPFLRYERVVVAAPDHPLAGERSLRAADLAGQHWLTGPGGIEAGSEEERWADRAGFLPDVTAFDSEAAAGAAVRAGSGLLLALGHAVAEDTAGARSCGCRSRARRRRGSSPATRR